jgi:hypothetical protein
VPPAGASFSFSSSSSSSNPATRSDGVLEWRPRLMSGLFCYAVANRLVARAPSSRGPGSGLDRIAASDPIRPHYPASIGQVGAADPGIGRDYSKTERYSNTPLLHHSTTPPLQCSITPRGRIRGRRRGRGRVRSPRGRERSPPLAPLSPARAPNSDSLMKPNSVMCVSTPTHVEAKSVSP